MDEEIKCKFGHTWGGILPVVDPAKWEDQFPQFQGHPCDCNKLIFIERLCTCPLQTRKWEIKCEENPNYGKS